MCTITNNKLHNMLLMLLLCDVLDPVTYHFKLNTQTLYNFTFIKRNDRQVSKQNFQFWTLHDRRARTSSDFQTIRWVETQTLWTPSLRLLPTLPAKHIIIINHHHHHRSCRRHQQQQTAAAAAAATTKQDGPDSVQRRFSLTSLFLWPSLLLIPCITWDTHAEVLYCLGQLSLDTPCGYQWQLEGEDTNRVRVSHSANWTQRDEDKRRPTNMLLRPIISSDITSHAHYSAMVNQQLTADCDHTQHIPEPCACLSFFHVITFSQSTSVQLHLIPHHLLSATSCRRHSAPMMLNLYIITAYTCL